MKRKFRSAAVSDLRLCYFIIYHITIKIQYIPIKNLL